MKRPLLLHFILAALILGPAISSSLAQEKKALEVEDLMKFRQIQSPAISDEGDWIYYTAKPDRGDPEVQVYSADGKTEYLLPGSEKPKLSKNGSWLAAIKSVPELVKLNADKGKEPLPGMILMNTNSGEQEILDSIQSFNFSNDGSFLCYQKAKTEKGKEKKEQGDKTSTLIIRSLHEGKEYIFPEVSSYSIDSLSNYLAIAIIDTTGRENGLILADLNNLSEDPLYIYKDSSAWVKNITWNNVSGQLAFLAGVSDEKDQKKDASLYLWSTGKQKAWVALEDQDLEEGWKLYHTNNLGWSRDGKRLFLGSKPEEEIFPAEEEADTIVDLYKPEEILAGRGVDVWHWNDPLINSHQKKQWKKEKDRVYMGVYHLAEKRFVQLADRDLPEVRISDNPNQLLAYSNKAYAKEQTWNGRFYDYSLVDLQTGKSRLILEHHDQTVRLSPDGKKLIFYRDRSWYVMDAASLKSRELTADMDVPFEDEDWDYPEATPGYGSGGWINKSEAVIIYDKYDIWLFPADEGKATCLTEGLGRKEKYQFRIKNLDREKQYLESGETVFLSAYHDQKKHTALYSMEAGENGVKLIFEEEKKYTLLAKARDADKVMFSRQSYREFPDLWISDIKFKKPRKVTDVNPQTADFAWGNAKLVDWHSVDGTPMQGILITPENAEPGQKFPVLVYYYRFFTNRLYDFNHVAVNHRPCFPFYASNGYAVFLPDIRFDIGTPGYSATKCLVPGVQKIVDMGVADPEAICLHGHSWSGYQTAFAITQTDIFTCAIAGAPVSNMTSAYSGIRWESGMARQFQYEKSQSRIGADLWNGRDKYIENSPVFFADRISTPLLIQFGDVDGAVPWYQGIELYLAMRRLEKDCIFLQYRNEGHHLKQYANKLDYTLKFKAYLDHYLKGEAPEQWISEGVLYRGK